MYLNSQILILTESGMPEISHVFDIFSSLVISNWPDGPGDVEHRPGTHLVELITPLSGKPTPPLFAPVVPPTSPPTAAVQPTAPTAWLGPVALPTMGNPPDGGWGSWQLCPSPLFACCPKDCPVTPDGLAVTEDCWNIRPCLWPRNCNSRHNAMICRPILLTGCGNGVCWARPPPGQTICRWARPRRELVASPGDRDLLWPRQELAARLCTIRRLLHTG